MPIALSIRSVQHNSKYLISHHLKQLLTSSKAPFNSNAMSTHDSVPVSFVSGMVSRSSEGGNQLIIKSKSRVRIKHKLFVRKHTVRI